MADYELYRYLERAAAQSGRSQAEIAKCANLSPSSVCNILKGTDLPSELSLKLIVTALGRHADLRVALHLCELERLKKRFSKTFDSFASGVKAVVELALDQRSKASAKETFNMDVMVTWMHDEPEEDDSVTRCLERLLNGFCSENRDGPLLNLRFCTTAPSNLGLVVSRYLHSALLELRSDLSYQANAMQLGLGRVAEKVVANIQQISDNEAWLDRICLGFKGRAEQVRIVHRLNYAWSGYPAVCLHDHLALSGFYPSSDGYCGAPAQASFVGAPLYAMVRKDFELQWDFSLQKRSTEECLRTDMQPYFLQSVEDQFADSSSWKGLVLEFMDMSCAEYVRHVLRTPAEARDIPAGVLVAK